MAVGDIGGIGPGQPPLDVRAIAAQVALTNAKILASALMPGEIITGRVGADLGDGNVALTVRGQTLIANSVANLLPDSVVKLLVQSAGEQPVLRILATTTPEAPLTSTPAVRAATLGLPATPLAVSTLQAFEQAGAPLDPVRLKEAVAQLQTLPAAQVPQRAQALAVLAQAGLPATPPFVALAERSSSGALPNPAAAVGEFQRLVQAQPVPAAPIAPGASPAPSNILASPPPAAAATSIQAQPGATPAATTVQPAPVVAPTTIVQSPSSVLSDDGSAATTTEPEAETPAPAPAPTTSAPRPALAPSTAPLATIAVVPSSVPTPGPTVAVQVPLAPGAPVPATAGPASGLVLPQVPVFTTLAGTLVPDLARGGATAVLQALVLAGVRPRDTGEIMAPRPEPTLLHRLDVPVEEPDPARPMGDATSRPPQQQMEAAVAHVMREQAAETVVKPQALVDYDIVLGLPLAVNNQPMPARLAIAERQTSAGTATFLRVDAELTALGPLSVRISGIENGPMAITVLATGPALGALSDAMPDLAASLRELGLAAGVRLADLAEDLAGG